MFNIKLIICHVFPIVVSNVSDCRSRGREFDPARSHTFADIDHEIKSCAILLPSADSRRVVVSYKRKNVHEVLVT